MTEAICIDGNLLNITMNFFDKQMTFSTQDFALKFA